MFHVEHHGDLIASVVSKHAADLRLKLSSRQLELISAYADELVVWNRKMNLTSISPPVDFAIKHFLDSLYGMQLICRQGQTNIQTNMLDIGAGAGFPGIPLKIADPDLELYLLERNKKKASFLSNIIGKLRLPGAHVIASTAKELVSKRPSSQFMNIVVRAVNITEIFGELPLLLRSVGRAILYRSRPILPSDIPHSLRIRDIINYELPLGFGKRSLVVVERN